LVESGLIVMENFFKINPLFPRRRGFLFLPPFASYDSFLSTRPSFSFFFFTGSVKGPFLGVAPFSSYCRTVPSFGPLSDELGSLNPDRGIRGGTSFFFFPSSLSFMEVAFDPPVHAPLDVRGLLNSSRGNVGAVGFY